MLRPGDPAYFDILHAFNGYRTCYYRTFAVGSARRAALVDAYKRCRDILDHAISLIRPGRVDGRRRRPSGRRRRSSASPTRRRRSRSSTGTASGSRAGRSRSSAGSSRSTTRRRSRRGWCSRSRRSGPRRDGWQAARIEEQLVVTSDGCEVITRFPAEELLVAGGRHYTVGGGLPAMRETQSHLNNPGSPTRSSSRRASRRAVD